ncbi:MAG TPA: hypothetical protein VNM14_22205 [Planctomycetota bacterium]|nr:hypothetical protein [Planctomycetota bacterium]
MSSPAPKAIVAACLGILALSCGTLQAAADPQEPREVDVTLTNPFDKEFVNLPVLLQVFRVFGRGVDYGRFNPDGFHVYDDKNSEVEVYYRALPPSFSIADDQLVLLIPRLAPGARLQFRFTNSDVKSDKLKKLDPSLLIDNPNNLIPNGGFEKGNEGWEGGKVVSDGVHSGKAALLLEVPGAGGNASLRCTKPVSFIKGMSYYFGVWGKCENVTRRTWRYTQPWAATPISGRLSFSGDPLVFPEFSEKAHLIRFMDDRDWYCYEANAISTLCVPQPALNTCESTLTLALNQENMPYSDPRKPARVWIDEALLFEQPQVAVSSERLLKKAAPDGFFLYRRAATCLNEPLFAVPQLPGPRAYERIQAIHDAAALGERKVVTLGVSSAAPIQGLCLDVSDLKGPGGAVLGESVRDIEFTYTPTVGFKFHGKSLEGWVIDGNAPREFDRPGYADYLISYRIAPNTAPGMYAGTVKVRGNGKDLAEIPLELEVVNLALKPITDRYAGLIYNAGMNCDSFRFAPGYEGTNGAVLPPRDEKFYRYYARSNFPYMMMFCNFLPFKGSGTEVDLPQLIAQMKTMRDVAGCTAGVGLYPDCSLDKQGNNNGPEGGHGLWTRCGKNPEAYRARVKEMDDALAKAGLPPLVYMIWDEPRFCDPAKFGILKGTSAKTTSDINYRECCEQLERGLFTHASVDGPGCDYGPAMRKLAARVGQKIGFDSYAGPFCNRYQTGFMLSNGAATASFWHVGYYMGYHPGHQAFVRGQNAVGLAEGLIDFRYVETLRELIATAKSRKKAAREVDAAEKFLKDVLDFCTDDFHFMSEIEIFTYNGGPERWGDDWFYERWRTGLRNHALAIQKVLGPVPVGGK